MPKTPLNSHKPGKEPKQGKAPPLEDVIGYYIENESDKKRALDFTKWLRANKLSPSAGNNGYNWYVKFYYINQNIIKNEKYHRSTYHGVFIKLFNDTWHVLPSKDILEQILLCDELKDVILGSLFPCYGCNYGCFDHTHNSERSKILFGREVSIKGICLRQPVCFSNPDDNTLDILKSILIKRKTGDDLLIGQNMNIYNYGTI